MKRTMLGGVSCFTFLLFSAGIAGQELSAVSPGSATGALIESRCPTFSWGEVEGTKLYDLVVYRLGADSGEAKPILRQSFAGSVSSWTPSLDRCLERGAQYAWSVRAVGHRETSGWSSPNLFRVSPDPSVRELEQALGLVRRYLDSSGTGAAERAATEDSLPQPTTTEKAKDAASADPVPAGRGLGGADFSVDSSGNVLGSSFGGDGSGLTHLDWDQLVNVPAGFADNSDDGIAYAAGNQLMLSGTTFNVTEGSGSDLDADLLDGEHKAYFSPQATTYSKIEVDALLTVDNIDAPIPDTPRFLRIGPEYRFPGRRRLSWSSESLAGVAFFVVYQSDTPITEENKASVHRQVTSSLYAAVDLFPGSGLQHFRVEAQNVLGEAGPLSPELVIDTTSRLAYWADQRAVNLRELFTVASTGGEATRVSADLVSFGNVQAFAWSPDGSRVAYRADQDTDEVYELYTASATGGGATKVNDPLVSGGSVYLFAWSPNGSYLAYRADQDTDDVVELYAVPAAGGGAIKVNDALAADRSVVGFAWSPDGSRLAYIADQDTDNVFELYVVSDGGAIRVSDPSTVGDLSGFFAWSPDGSRLAYLADQDTSGKYELYVVSAAGGGATKVNDPLMPDGDIDGLFLNDPFAWSPDGSRLAYRARQTLGDVYELYVVPATGGGAIKVNDPLVSGGSVTDFAWSPDGSRLAYWADQDSYQVGELYVVPAAGGGSTKLSDPFGPSEHMQEFGWSPDGSRLAYRTYEALRVVSAAAAGSTIVNDPLIPTGSVYGFAWSPDASRLAYRADQDTDQAYELYVVSAAGGGATKVNDSLVTNGRVWDFAWSPLGVE